MSLTWEEFVTDHARTVINAALRVVANPDDAEDVAQEVFLEIFRSKRMPQFANQPALLHTIATRRALDRLRRRKSASRLAGSELDAREPEPSQNAIAAELDLRLQEALADLPPRESEVFCLSTLDGYSAAEIAGFLGISKGAVAKALCMARSRLSAVFSDSPSEPVR